MWAWKAYGQTDRGLVRPTNQDAFLTDDRHRLWAVADGMGGHAGGDMASRLVADTLHELAPSLSQGTMEKEHITSRLTGMVQRAHANVLDYANRHPPLQGMGSTLVLAHLLPFPSPLLTVVNVGDSRAYLIRASSITQLTRDHTLIDKYIREGSLTPAQAACHPDRHVLTRAVGLAPCIDGDISSCDLLNGDVVLLCSDGLTKMLTDERILHVAMPHRYNPLLSAQALIRTALEAGGIDNVTVIVCTITDTPDPSDRR